MRKKYTDITYQSCLIPQKNTAAICRYLCKNGIKKINEKLDILRGGVYNKKDYDYNLCVERGDQMKRTVLSLLMAVAVIVSALPINSFADALGGSVVFIDTDKGVAINEMATAENIHTEVTFTPTQSGTARIITAGYDSEGRMIGTPVVDTVDDAVAGEKINRTTSSVSTTGADMIKVFIWSLNDTLHIFSRNGLLESAFSVTGRTEKLNAIVGKTESEPYIALTNATVNASSLFEAVSGAEINSEYFAVSAEPVGESTATAEFVPDTADWTKGTVNFSGTGLIKLTAQDYDFCIPAELYVNVIEPIDRYTTKFEHTDEFLYRVGNTNAVSLSSLFTADESELPVSDMQVTIDNVQGDVTGVFTPNATDWTKGTIQYSGTGVVKVTISDYYSNPAELLLEVVDAKNVITYSELGNANCVLLDDITMTNDSCIFTSGVTLYGNGFTFDVTNGGVSGTYVTNNYLIYLNNSTLDNVKIVGAVYTQYGALASSDYNRPVVLSVGDSTIANCYIANCAAPVRVNGGNLEVINTTLKGGNFANMDIRSGNAILDNVTTINQVNGNDLATDGTVVAGFGVVVFYQNVPSSTTVTVKNGITQYNNLSKAQANEYIMDSAAKQLTSVIFGDECEEIQYTDANGDIWVNAGILSMTEAVGDTNISDIEGYTSCSPVFMGTTGYVHSKVPTAASISANVQEYIATEQYAVAPSYVFEYPTESGKKNYLAKTEDSPNDYCVYEEATVSISMDAGDVFQWDPSILTVTKAGKEIDYTVTMNGIDYTGKKISFGTADNYTVVYNYTDDNNYMINSDGDIEVYEKTYTKEVNIDVKVVKAAWKDAQITIDASKADVSAKNNSYVLTDKMNYDYKYKLKFLSCITITDYDENGNASTVDLDSNIDSCETTAINGGDVELGENKPFTITLKYDDGRSIKVRLDWIGSTPGTKTCTVNTSDNDVYIISDGASDACNTDVNWSVSDVTFTGNSGAAVNDKTKVTYYWNTSTDGYSSKSSCVTGDTLVTLADGSYKRIDEITYEDKLLVWDFYNGEYAAVPSAIISNHGYDNNTVVKLTFEDSTEVKVANLHQFFDADTNKFVTIDADSVADYIGHKFVKRDGNGYKTVKLMKYEISEEYIDTYGIISAVHYNILVEDMFSADYPYELYELMTYFEVGENLVYDKAKMESDINMYGLYSYEEFADHMTFEQFEAMNIKYMKISVGKGYYTYEGILALIEEYLK